eukprot:Colp12_sorted_trinity150504_noHs@8727
MDVKNRDAQANNNLFGQVVRRAQDFIGGDGDGGAGLHVHVVADALPSGGHTSRVTRHSDLEGLSLHLGPGSLLDGSSGGLLGLELVLGLALLRVTGDLLVLSGLTTLGAAGLYLGARDVEAAHLHEGAVLGGSLAAQGLVDHVQVLHVRVGAQQLHLRLSQNAVLARAVAQSGGEAQQLAQNVAALADRLLELLLVGLGEALVRLSVSGFGPGLGGNVVLGDLLGGVLLGVLLGLLLLLAAQLVGHHAGVVLLGLGNQLDQALHLLGLELLGQTLVLLLHVALLLATSSIVGLVLRTDTGEVSPRLELDPVLVELVHLGKRSVHVTQIRHRLLLSETRVALENRAKDLKELVGSLGEALLDSFLTRD